MAKTFTLNLACNKGHEYTATVENEVVRRTTKDGSLIINGAVAKGKYDPQESGVNLTYFVIDITLPTESMAYIANELDSPGAYVEEALSTESGSVRIFITRSRLEP